MEISDGSYVKIAYLLEHGTFANQNVTIAVAENGTFDIGSSVFDCVDCRLLIGQNAEVRMSHSRVGFRHGTALLVADGVTVKFVHTEINIERHVSSWWPRAVCVAFNSVTISDRDFNSYNASIACKGSWDYEKALKTSTFNGAKLNLALLDAPDLKLQLLNRLF